MATYAKVRGERIELPALDDLTHREMRIFKQASGLRAGELPDAAEAGDNDILVGLVAVGIHRAHGKVDIEALLDTKVIAMNSTIENDEGQVDANPPALTPELNGEPGIESPQPTPTAA